MLSQADRRVWRSERRSCSRADFLPRRIVRSVTSGLITRSAMDILEVSEALPVSVKRFEQEAQRGVFGLVANENQRIHTHPVLDILRSPPVAQVRIPKVGASQDEITLIETDHAVPEAAVQMQNAVITGSAWPQQRLGRMAAAFNTVRAGCPLEERIEIGGKEPGAAAFVTRQGEQGDVAREVGSRRRSQDFCDGFADT